MIKTFVLDTNVLLHDPESMYSFQENNIVIPMGVIEELDGFKRANDERGRSARLIARRLDGLRRKGKLSEGVKLKSGGTLRIDVGQREDVPPEFSVSQMDGHLHYQGHQPAHQGGCPRYRDAGL